MIFIISILISFSVLSETVGVYARAIGAARKEFSIGYSLHVRIATLGRAFTLLAAPLLGFYVDSGEGVSGVALMGFISFGVNFIVGYFFYKKGGSFCNKIYGILNKSNADDVVVLNDHKLRLKGNRGLILSMALSYSLTAIGLIVVNMMALLFIGHRAMIVQLSAVITSVGTLIHVFYIDPELAKASDNDPGEILNLVNIFVITRSIQSLVLSVVFLGVYFWVDRQ